MKNSSFLYQTSLTNTQNKIASTSSIDELLSNMQKDLENLLNTRRQPFSLPSEFKEVTSSVLGYGLDDFSHILSFSQINLQRMAIDIEKTLRLFEPRFSKVKVEIEKDTQEHKKQVLFKIIASLNVGRKTFSVYSHLNFHLQNQIYRFLNWSFDYAG
ncbi:MAG: type VI secretion system baseplate subunit TssE [Alphaproteobacteria bacterium]|nr:type VI secretion system baseplate subunit TssE [Alphaproteobacteria bacterium]